MQPYPAKCCLRCADYIAPPEESRRRADEGYCSFLDQRVNERSSCDEFWQEEDDE